MPNCINKSHPDYKALLEKTGLNPLILNAKISIWQEANSTEAFPAYDDIVPTADYFENFEGEITENPDEGFLLLTPSPTSQAAQSQNAFNNMFNYPVGQLTAYRLMKQQMLDNATTKIRNLDNIRRTNKTTLSIQQSKDLAQVRSKLVQLQKELEEEVEELEKSVAKTTTVVAPYIEKDLERAKMLANSLNPTDIKEAQEITDFIAGMAEFNPDKIARFHYQRHPVYTDEELKAGIAEDEKEVFRGWKAKADAISENLSIKRTEVANDIINGVGGITATYGKAVDINELKKNPLKDTSWIDMMIMDITHGIFSNNGIIPQAMSYLFSNEMEVAQANHRANEAKIKNLEPAVKRELKLLKEQNPGLFEGIKSGTDFSVFFQKNDRGLYSNGAALVEMYSADFTNSKKIANSKFRATYSNSLKATGQSRASLMQGAYTERFRWSRENEIVFDPRKISAIRNNPQLQMFSNLFGTVTQAEVDSHETSIKNLIDDTEYDEKVQELTQHLVDFIHVLETNTQELLNDEGVTRYDDLSNNSKTILERFELKNSPFVLAQSILTGRFNQVTRVNGSFNVYPDAVDKYVSIPRKAESYDKSYKLIQSNPVLKDFYGVAKDITSHAASVLPTEYQFKINSNTLYYLPKVVKEIMLDNEGSVFARISDVLRKMFYDLLSVFGMQSQSNMSYAHRNFITGEQNYTINSSFASANVNKIDTIKNLEIDKFKILSGIKAGLNALSVKNLNQETKDYLGNIFGDKFDNLFGANDTINVYALLDDFAHHQAMMDSSMNLFNILKVYSNLATQYEARNNVLPIIENLKQHYNEIKDAALNNTGENTIIAQLGFKDNTGERSNAKSQLDSWFNNQILDNRGIKQHDGAVDKDVQSKRINSIAKKLGRSTGISFTKIKTPEEKRISKEINEAFARDPKLVADIQDALDTPKQSRTPDQNKIIADNPGIVSMIFTMNNLGRYFSISTVIKGLQKFLVAKLLGFNISSAATNFMEGQISNSLQAALGYAYPPEHAGYISVGTLIGSGVQARMFGEGKIPENVWILNSLIHKYDLLNDIGQELAVSSTGSVYDSFMGKYLMLPTRKVEYLNQAPLIASMLRDTQLVGKDGSITDIFDAMERVKVGEGFELKLKDNFNTDENRAAWLRDFEGLTKDQQDTYNSIYQAKKSKIDEIVKNAHGDYNKFSNMKIKDSALGQAFMTMRTWLPRQLYMRFAQEQDDIMLGVTNFKGVARSHTTLSAATVGALAGLMTGGVGLAIGGAALAAGFNGIGLIGKGKWGAKSNASTLQELSIMSQMLFLKMVGRPVNMVTGLVTMGKVRPFSPDTNMVMTVQNGKITKQDMGAMLIGNSFTEADLRNFRGNLTDISNIAMMYAIYFAAQMLLGGDDDEDKQRWNHLMVNKAMQLVSQATTYYNLYELGRQVDPNNTAVWKFITKDVGEFIENVATPGDIESYGTNSGKNKAWNSFSRAFIPGIVQSPFELGFNKQFERQFIKSPLDKYFWSDEKKAKEQVRDIRAEERLGLMDAGMTKEEANKALKRKYGSKDKNQSYVDYLSEIEVIQSTPSNPQEE